MPNEISLASCLEDAYRILFPTIDWGRVKFFDGLGFPYSLGSEEAITLSSGWSDCNVYLKSGLYDPCDPHCYEVIAHELVHVVQIQKSWLLGGRLNTWIFRYVSCTLASGSSSKGNAFEDEAYAFEGAVAACTVRPCACSNVVPWVTEIPNLEDAYAHSCPDLVKKGSRTTPFDCFAKLINLVPIPVIGWFIGVILMIVVIALAALAWLVYSIVDWLYDFFASVGGWIGGLFSGGGGTGALTLLFSTDAGLSFGNKITVGQTSDQPALVGDQTSLRIAWADTDNRINVLTPPNQNPETFEHNDDAGPAIALFDQTPYVAWQGTDNRLNIIPMRPAPDATFKMTLGETSPSAATPGLASVAERLWLAWIGGDGRLNVSSSLDGQVFEGKTLLDEWSGGDGTAALTVAGEFLYLAWAGNDGDNHLNVLSLYTHADGTVAPGQKVTLSERSSDDAGPALAFGGGRLYLTWTDDNQRVRIASSTDGLTFENKRDLGQGSDNAGPAVAVVGDAVVCVAYVDTG